MSRCSISECGTRGAVIAMSVAALSGCGGGDDSAAAPSDSHATPHATTSVGLGADARSGDAGPGGCPSGEAVSSVYGLEMEFNTSFSITEEWLVESMGGTTCQYNEVLAPGATDPSGLDAVAYLATIELMRDDPLAEATGAEQVAGVGDAAVWNGAQLSVRAGDRGVRVTNQFSPPGQDGRATAVALAQLALATEWPTAAAPGPDPGGDDCPPDDAVSAVWGKQVVLDADIATTGAVGLVFCPYEEVLAPGTTNAWGAEPVGDFFSITFTDHNVADPSLHGGEPVEGIGDQAAWNDVGELAVWTAGRGIIVSVPVRPDGRDARDVAVELAELVL